MKRVALFVVQVYCFLSHGFRHPWGREIDLNRHVALYKDTVVRVCARCASSKTFGR